MPEITTSLLTVVVPVGAPMLSDVAALAKLTVVAVVLTKSKLALSVVSDVVTCGLTLNNNLPEPDEPDSSVIADARFVLDGVCKNVEIPDPRPEIFVIERLLALVRSNADGVPRSGVTKAGLLENTKTPVPVSSEITPASSEEDVAANTLNLSVVLATLVIAPVDPFTEVTPALVIVTALPEIDVVIPVPPVKVEHYLL